MKNLKRKEEVVFERKNSIYESIHKMGDEYRVNGVIVPKSVINQFVSKAKKEYSIEAKENFAEIDLAQMFVDYIMKNYLNVDSLPVKTILGMEEDEESQIKDEVEAGDNDEFTKPEEQDDNDSDDNDSDVNVDIDIEAEENDDPSSEIKNNI